MLIFGELHSLSLVTNFNSAVARTSSLALQTLMLYTSPSEPSSLEPARCEACELLVCRSLLPCSSGQYLLRHFPCMLDKRGMGKRGRKDRTLNLGCCEYCSVHAVCFKIDKVSDYEELTRCLSSPFGLLSLSCVCKNDNLSIRVVTRALLIVSRGLDLPVYQL
jgi:hypothetical protein